MDEAIASSVLYTNNLRDDLRGRALKRFDKLKTRLGKMLKEGGHKNILACGEKKSETTTTLLSTTSGLYHIS